MEVDPSCLIQPLVTASQPHGSITWILYFLNFLFSIGAITSWQVDGETMETVREFIIIFFGSKITTDGDCSHEIKRCLLLGRKVVTNRDYIKKQRHYFPNKGQSSQSYGLSSSHVWM